MTNYRKTMAEALYEVHLKALAVLDKVEKEKSKNFKHPRQSQEPAEEHDPAPVNEWTISDVELAMKKKYGKVDRDAIEKLKFMQHMGNVDRNALVKVGHGKLHVEEVELDEADQVVTLPKGVGFYDTTNYPIGGKFNRVTDSNGMQITVKRRFKWYKGTDAEGITSDGRKVAFEMRFVKEELHVEGLHDRQINRLRWRNNVIATRIAEEKMSPNQIAQLKKAYEPMRGGRISTGNATKMGKMIGMIEKDKEALIQLMKADIPFVSAIATSRLISVHGMKGNEINKLKEELELDLNEDKMSQLHQYIKDGKTVEEIAKLMKIDVNTIKSLMNSAVEEGAADDARRAMARDKDLGSRKDGDDEDDDATDDEIKAASKNIIMQMRKAVSLRSYNVEFANGKKQKVDANIAQAIQNKYNNMSRPAEKEKFQHQIAKSYRDMLSALIEEKTSILDRISKKIKEIRNG